MGKNLGVSVSYINTNKNVVADKESRKLRNNLEWSLQTPVFDKIRLVYGPVTTDLFTSRINARVGVFILIPHTLKLVVMMLFHFHGNRNIFMHFPHFLVSYKL